MAANSIIVELTLKNGEYLAQIQKSKRATKDFVDESASGWGLMKTAAQAFIGLQVARYIVQIGTSAIRASAQMEQWATSFRVLIGNAGRARQLLEDIRRMGAATPFETDELVQASQQLLGMGIAADDIVSTLTRLGDVASGLNVPIGELSYLYGQMQAQGRVMTQDLNQFAGRGIPIYTTLAEILHTNAAGVREMAAQGRIGFPQIEEAFRRMTQEGGQFNGMMQEQSRTLSGMWSTFNDALTESARTMGDEMQPALKQLLDNMTDLLTTDADNSSLSRSLGRMLGRLINRINQAVIGIRILFAETDEERAQLMTRWDAADALAQRYAADLLVFAAGNNWEYEQTPEGGYTGRRRFVPPGGQPTGWTTGFHNDSGAPPAYNAMFTGGNRPPGGGPGGGPGGPGGHGPAPFNWEAAWAEQEGFMLEEEAAYKDLLIRKNEADQAAADERVRIFRESFDAIMGLANQFLGQMSQISNMELQNRTANIDNEYQRRKSYIEANVTDETERAAQLKALEDEKDANIRRAKRQAAKEQKKLSTFETIINTFTGAMAAYKAMAGIPYVGPALGAAAAAATIALGMKQVQLIQAQPLPELYEGGLIQGTAAGTLVRAGERNQSEVIAPLDKLSDMMGSRTIQLVVDGRVLTEVVDNHRNKRAYSIGAKNYSYGGVYS